MFKLLIILESILDSIKEGKNDQSEEKKINFKNIKLVIIIKIFANIRRFLGLKYFCITQMGISNIKATKFQNHKNIHTSSIESRINQKK